MNRWLTFFLAIGIGLACTVGEVRAENSTPEQRPPEQRSPEQRPPEQRPAPTPQEIRRWIDNLASNHFEVREAATKHLERAGCAAVQPLSEAAQRDSLEVTCRAIRALEAIADRSDAATFEAAQTVLEQLAESKNRSVARRADVSLRSLGSARRRHALARVTELGGIIKPLTNPRGIILPNSDEFLHVQIVINKRWKGGDAGLIHLRRLEGLQTVYLAGEPPISDAAIEELERDLPNKVQRRGKAMLGVMCSSIQGPDVAVTSVAPGTAADKAGLEVGDTIVKYAGEEITTFDRLIEITKGKDAGEKIAIEIIRDGKAMKLEAVLTEWQ